MQIYFSTPYILISVFILMLIACVYNCEIAALYTFLHKHKLLSEYESKNTLWSSCGTALLLTLLTFIVCHFIKLCVYMDVKQIILHIVYIIVGVVFGVGIIYFNNKVNRKG